MRRPEAGDDAESTRAASIAHRVLSAIGTDPTQAFVLLDTRGAPRWATPSIASVFDVDLTADDPFTAAMHPDDLPLVADILSAERDGRADEAFDPERRFELLVRMRSPRGAWRWVALRLHNRIDDPSVDGMVLQLTLANQERSTVEAFDAAAAGAPTAEIVERVLDTLASGGIGDSQAVAFDADGVCVAATANSTIGPGDRIDSDAWRRMSDGRVDVTVPITGPQGAVIGTLVTVSNFPDVRPFTAALAAAVARRVGLVLQSAADRDELERQARSDPLTGLANRRYLYDHLERTRLDGWLSVAFVDLDGFKGVNDRFGHHVGDGVLVEVTRRLRTLECPGDLVARLGGDEFVLVRHGVDAATCELSADAVAATVDGPFVIDGHHVSIAASVGVATVPADERLDVMRMADAAMYRDKLTRRS